MIYEFPLLFILATWLVIVILHRRHVERRTQERLCKCKNRSGTVCGKPTVRRYQMIIPVRSSERVGLWTKLFRSVIFDECPDGHVKLMSAVNKRFTLITLGWRHIHDPQQFIIDETLFQRAGLIEQVQLDLISRMKRAEIVKLAKSKQPSPAQHPSGPPAFGPKKKQ